MKIAQVNVYFYPFMVGGAEWYVYNISRELVKKGHEVHVFTADTYRNETIHPKEDIIEDIHVHRIPMWFDLTYRTKLWKGLRRRLQREDFDVIHTYDYGQPHSYVTVKTGMTLKKPVALTVFDVHSMIPRPFYKNVPLKLFDKFLARFTLKNATGILVRAPNLVQPLVNMGAPRQRMYVTPSGIDAQELFPADGTSFRKKYSISGKPIILYLGRLHPMKGPQYLIMASPAIIERYSEVVFVFVGPDQSNFRNQLGLLGEKLGVQDHLVFTGAIYDFHLKMSAYAASDVFVLPSGYEGTSQAVFQAMAQAKPIVATNRGGIPFQVKNGQEAILVEYGDEKAIVQAVLKLLGDPRLAKQLGFRSREKVKQFTYPVLVNQIEEIYNKMLRA